MNHHKLDIAFVTSCLEGNENTEDLAKAVAWLEIESGLGNIDACFLLGDSLIMGTGMPKDKIRGANLLLLAAQTGHRKAMTLIGLCYRYGSGLKADSNEAVKWLKMAAEEDETLALRELGLCFKEGAGVEVDQEEAFFLFRCAARKGDPFAMKILADCYYKGEGVKPDVSKALQWYMRASKAGVTSSNFMIAELIANGLLSDLDREIALPIVISNLENSVSENDFAQYFLGHFYLNGVGVPQDIHLGTRLLLSAAQQGMKEAQYEYALACKDRLLLDLDVKNAVKWFKAAAEQKHVQATRELVNCYLEGMGVDTNINEAIFWLNVTPEALNKEILYRLGCMLRDGQWMTQKETPEDYFRKASELGHFGASHEYGLILLKNKRYALARIAFDKAITQGCVISMVRMAEIYELALDSPKPDFEKVVKYYRMAAEEGDAQSMFALSKIYREGREGVTSIQRNSSESTRLIRLASERKYPKAVTQLGKDYITGYGVEKNYDEAEQYLSLAIELGDQSAEETLAQLITRKELLERAEKGEAYAQYELAYWEQRVIEQSIDLMGEMAVADFSEVERLYKLSADQDFIPSIVRLGLLYQNYYTDSSEKVFSLMHRAAVENEMYAQVRLARLYQSGVGCERDVEMAVHWFEKAAANGDVCSQYELGLLYSNIDSANFNYDKGLSWFNKAADNNHTESLIALAIYFERILTPPDFNKAQEYYDKAYMIGRQIEHSETHELFSVCKSERFKIKQRKFTFNI